nr:hypothetical protein [Rhizobium binae]
MDWRRPSWTSALTRVADAQLAVLKRARFGASSEKIDRAIEQLELPLEDIETAEAEAVAASSLPDGHRSKGNPSRQPLPDHLPRHEVVHQVACACPVCGGSDFIRDGETVSEVLDYMPPSPRVGGASFSSRQAVSKTLS